MHVRIQESVNSWGNLLIATGGALQPAKCFYSIISFKWINGGWRYALNDTNTELGVSVPLPGGGTAGIGHKLVTHTKTTLGAMTSPDGNSRAAIMMMQDKAQRWVNNNGVCTSAASAEIILFIDEMHTVVGAGATSGGSMDASNLLKPALTRGQLQCIGATTINEYRKYIKKDKALERRFRQIYIGKPSPEDTVFILRGLKARYEVHHGVPIRDKALLAAARLSSRYLPDRFLPDKAINLIDEACVKLKNELSMMPTALDEIDRQIIQLEMEKLSLSNDRSAALDNKSSKANRARLSQLENEIYTLKIE